MRHDEAFRRVESELYLYRYYREALATTLEPSIPSALGDPNTRVQHSVTDGTTAAMGIRRAEYSLKVQAIERCYALLTPTEREFFKLRYQSQLPYTVIARELYMSEATAWRMRRRVLARFAVMLQLIWDEGRDGQQLQFDMATQQVAAAQG